MSLKQRFEKWFLGVTTAIPYQEISSVHKDIARYAFEAGDKQRKERDIDIIKNAVDWENQTLIDKLRHSPRHTMQKLGNAIIDEIEGG